MSTSNLVSNNSSISHENRQSFSKLKPLGFAILIILGVGGLVVASIGLAGSQQAAGLGGLNSFNAFMMIGVGAPFGITLLTLGVLGYVKHSRASAKECEYDQEAWNILGITVADQNIPPRPNINWNETDPFFGKAFRENYVLLYIPEKIRVGEEEKYLTLQTLYETNRDQFAYLSESVAREFGNSTSHGWVLLSKNTIPNSANSTYEKQKSDIENAPGFRMLKPLEAAAMRLIVPDSLKGSYIDTREGNYKASYTNAFIYTRCGDKASDESTVIVGGTDPARLHATSYPTTEGIGLGAAIAKKF